MECPEVKHHPYNTTTRTTLEWSGGWYCLQVKHHPYNTTTWMTLEWSGGWYCLQVKHHPCNTTTWMTLEWSGGRYCLQVEHHPCNTTTRTTLEWSGEWYCLQVEHHPCHTTHLDNLGVEWRMVLSTGGTSPLSYNPPGQPWSGERWCLQGKAGETSPCHPQQVWRACPSDGSGARRWQRSADCGGGSPSCTHGCWLWLQPAY